MNATPMQWFTQASRIGQTSVMALVVWMAMSGCSRNKGTPAPTNPDSATTNLSVSPLTPHDSKPRSARAKIIQTRTPELSPSGHIAFALPGSGFAIIEAKAGAKPETLDSIIGRAGKDSSLTLAPRGPWMTLVTTRFGCGQWACLAVGRGPASTWTTVRVASELVHPEGPAAIAPSGHTVVWEGSGTDGHRRDLYAASRQGDGWTKPKRLTAGSKHTFHGWPSFSPDGSRVVFDCGDVPYAGEGTGICEAAIDGNDVKRLVAARGKGWQEKLKAAHHASYAPDGSIVFEGDTDGAGEQVWRLTVAGKASVIGSFHNDNSPCVLPDGRIASLFMGRAGSAGHELKVMGPTGESSSMLIQGRDLRDIVLSCGQ